MMIKFLLISCVILFFGVVNSSKILCVFPSPSPSHLIVAKGLTTALAEKGHDVTMVSSFPLDKPMKNYRDIHVPVDIEIKALMSSKFLEMAGKRLQFTVNMLKTMIPLNIRIMNDTFYEPTFQKVMKEESFDLVILGMVGSNVFLGLGAHFKCPIVVFNMIGTNRLLNSYVGNPNEIAYVPHMMMSNINGMGFKHRLFTMVIAVVEKIFGWVVYPKYVEYYNSIFPVEKYPPLDDMWNNVSLVLLNSHFSQGNARPYVPAMIEIGGIQIKEKLSPLPEDLKQWLDSSKYGAIYFSMGSNIKTVDLGAEKLDGLLKTFGKLKQNVIWKFETDNIPNLPKNVKVWKWLPQNEILAHPNLKLFISHGGLGSVIESKYYGVPIVSIPLFGDQQSNADTLFAEGWGLKVPFAELNEETLTAAVQEIITNPKYTEKVKQLSILYRDRPLSARETGVYWIEYVIRHQGAKHMQSNSVHLSFMQLNSIDTIAVLLTTLFIVLYIVFKINLIIIKFLYRKLFKRNCIKTKKE